MQHKLIISLFFLTALLSACSDGHKKVSSKPKWVIDEKKMVDMIVDLRIVDAATYNNNSGPPRDKSKDWYFVMKKYKVEDSIFRKSHDYYCKYPEVLEVIYEEVIDKLSEMQAVNAENVGLVDTLSHK